jgi:hypothetical protein
MSSSSVSASDPATWFTTLARTLTLPLGLSDVDGEPEISLPEGRSALGSLASQAEWTTFATVPVVRCRCAFRQLDGLRAELGLPAPASLKVDVEGAERLVFRGAEGLARLRLSTSGLVRGLRPVRTVVRLRAERGAQRACHLRLPLSVCLPGWLGAPRTDTRLPRAPGIPRRLRHRRLSARPAR